jgi:NADH-quinone oxidoreductase subunit L
MAKMGGLRKAMPVTAGTMAIATLAIAGIPPLAGFWSKDEILGVVFAKGGMFSLLWIVGLITALLTAFYMTRQYVLVFLGAPRWEAGTHPHESPKVMTVPLLILAMLSVVGGLLNTPFRTSLEHFLEPSFEGITATHPPEGVGLFLLLAGLSVMAGVAGITAGYLAYSRPEPLWLRFQAGFGRLWQAWEKAYRIDDLYGALLVKPGRRLAERGAFSMDLGLVDGLVNGVGGMVRGGGRLGRRLQTGFVRSYGAIFAAGFLVVVIWMLARG